MNVDMLVDRFSYTTHHRVDLQKCGILAGSWMTGEMLVERVADRAVELQGLWTNFSFVPLGRIGELVVRP